MAKIGNEVDVSRVNALVDSRADVEVHGKRVRLLQTAVQSLFSTYPTFTGRCALAKPVLCTMLYYRQGPTAGVLYLGRQQTGRKSAAVGTLP